ncbi:MAG: SGNH/GDSL hydrolase family protein [Solirubrobacterales bacterium]|nr:SGNH/GDSL hydrolase family protein [Solirubrobacterales bacterium]
MEDLAERDSWQRFVALGDSQTEGVGDPTGPAGLERGWADRFAETLAAHQGELLYANLAIRGRLIAQVEQEQLEPTLAMEPDLVSLVAGLNDVIRPGCEVDSVLERMDRMQARLSRSGATVLTITYPDPARMMPAGKYLADTFAAFNRGLREIAARHGTRLLDIEPIAAATDGRLWCPDRLHLNPLGHERLASGMIGLIDPTVDPDGWLEGLPQQQPPGPVRRTAAELRWAAAFLAPWIWRRLRGRSSGDGRVARRPLLTPVRSEV